MNKVEAIRKVRDLIVRLRSAHRSTSDEFDRDFHKLDDEIRILEIDLGNLIDDYMADKFNKVKYHKDRNHHESGLRIGQLSGRWNHQNRVNAKNAFNT